VRTLLVEQVLVFDDAGVGLVVLRVIDDSRRLEVLRVLLHAPLEVEGAVLQLRQALGREVRVDGSGEVQTLAFHLILHVEVVCLGQHSDFILP